MPLKLIYLIEVYMHLMVRGYWGYQRGDLPLKLPTEQN